MQPSIFEFLEEKSQENLSKEQINDTKINREIHQLLNNLSSATTNTLRDKVAWLLNHYPEARDSDITLLIKFWETFEADKYNGQYIKPDDLYRLTRLTSISRERARIQNIYKLFLASSEVRQRRGTLSDTEKEKAINDKPIDCPSLVIYMDESGKNAEQLIVGSLWFLEAGKSIFDVYRTIIEFKKDRRFDKEFHFSEMSQRDLPIYQEMVKLFLREAPAISFKIASLPTSGIRDKQSALNQLFYHLIIQGIKHENETGRAILPRSLQIWKDSEEEGSDHLLVADLDDRLKQASSSRFDSKLLINLISCADSAQNLFLQIADLLSASANRILNQTNISKNHKTEFAEFFLDLIGVDRSFTPNDQIGDTLIHISL